jgi:hypothetical protein
MSCSSRARLDRSPHVKTLGAAIERAASSDHKFATDAVATPRAQLE